MMMLEICEGAHHALKYLCVLCNVDDVPGGGC